MSFDSKILQKSFWYFIHRRLKKVKNYNIAQMWFAEHRKKLKKITNPWKKHDPITKVQVFICNVFFSIHNKKSKQLNTPTHTKYKCFAFVAKSLFEENHRITVRYSAKPSFNLMIKLKTSLPLNKVVSTKNTVQ